MDATVGAVAEETYRGVKMADYTPEPDECRDCGDVLGAGSLCRRCKFVSAGNSENDFDAYMGRWIESFNRAGKYHGWQIIKAEGNAVTK